jgi:hypothetical protein
LAAKRYFLNSLQIKLYFAVLLIPLGVLLLVVNFQKYHVIFSYIPYINKIKVAHAVGKTTKNTFYYGVGVDMSQLLPGSDRYVVTSKGEDLIDLASRLGITMFRITNATPASQSGDTTYTKKQWDTVLNKMQRKGIKAVILIESPHIYQKYITSDYLPFVKKYIVTSGVLDHSNVYGIDLYNEPVINSENNIVQMQRAAALIKAKYPKTKVTVGWWAIDTFKKDTKGKEIYIWNNYAAGKMLSFVDFYAIHMYGFDKSLYGLYPDPYSFTKAFLTDVENGLQTKKPILIEEFGAANGETLSDQDTLGSPEIQANAYQGVYQYLQDTKDSQIIGAVAYQFNSRSNGPDAWAIIKDNGTYLFTAAYVLQRYAKE